ncbi:hypothetical protein PLICRDRAFT_57628 [Plicaturopsis crispa FD-325 SS-3]|uniref:Uncharacterized protein n=1 Tax=Plicaturopsis crispa FD-325 SS-3 TaxID=944288 RepID=A0A0C9SL09_PLICR|nr:hypothetical protein PLICRDRAFT_57628 [Plicaturopsis crispa FD-325 SS-3]
MGMSPASRYNHNLKVLRRRDPSIVSIFDQFSHVCVYHHNGSKWEKQGFEGSMFLYERESYPPYGFYILNRMGMDDYIQRLYPEDEINIHGSYLMVRTYPDFTRERLERAAALGPPTPGDKFSERYIIPNLEDLTREMKGRQQTRALWMFARDAREPIMDVMERLHSYIKRNEPYPERFRYGPHRPPPYESRSNSEAEETSSYEEDSSDAEYMDVSNGSHSYRSPPSTSVPLQIESSSGQIDELFARLTPREEPLVEESPPTTTSNLSIDELFAAMSHPPSERPAPDPQPRGLALLDTLFASATPPPSAGAGAHQGFTNLPSSRPPSTHIISPKPIPQVLTQDVISSLLGLPSHRDHDSDSDIGSGYSESSTVLDDDADMELQAAGSSSGLPLLSLPVDEHEGESNAAGRTFGDVTPRASHRSRLHALEDAPYTKSTLSPPSSSSAHLSPSSSSHLSPLSSSSHLSSSHSAFAADASLWPYPRAPLDSDSHPSQDTQPDDLVELDFSDTSALSDPAKFAAKAGRGRKGGRKGRREEARERRERREQRAVENGDGVSPSANDLPAPGPSNVPASAAPATNGKSRANGHSNGHGNDTLLDQESPLDHDSARDALVTTFGEHKGHLRGMARNEFVREVLTLIHTDKAFVEALWQDYMARLG